MSIRNYSEEALLEAAENEQAGIEQLEAESRQLQVKIEKLQAKITERSERIRKHGWKIEWLQRARLIREGITEEMQKAHKKYKRLLKRAADENVTVAESRKRKAKASEAWDAFAEMCHHPFILYVNGFEGSYCMDYDDSYYGELACVVCGKTAHGNDYEHGCDDFPEEDFRVFNRVHDDYRYNGVPYAEHKDKGLRERLRDYKARDTLNAIQDMFTWPRVLDEVKETLGEPPKRTRKKAG